MKPYIIALCEVCNVASKWRPHHEEGWISDCCCSRRLRILGAEQVVTMDVFKEVLARLEKLEKEREEQ